MTDENNEKKIKKLQRTVRFFEALLRASADGIVITDSARNIIFVNDTFCKYFSCNRNDVIETNILVWLEKLGAGSAKTWTELERKTKKNGTVRDIELREEAGRCYTVNSSLLEQVDIEEPGLLISIWRDDTERIMAKEALQRVNDELEMRVRERTAELTGINAALAEEIGERRRVEEELRSYQQKLSFHLQQTMFGVIEWDTMFRVKYWNPAAEKIFGYSGDEAMGQWGPNLIIPERIRDEIDGVWNDLLSQKGGVYNTNVNLTKDGRKITCEWFNTPLVDESGRVTGVMSFVTDITERRIAEEKARQLQEYLKMQIDRMPIGMIVWDRDFRAREWNPAAAKIFGFTDKEALGKHPYEFIVPAEARHQVDDIWGRLLQGDLTAYSVNENITKDGRTIICDWTNTPLKGPDGETMGVLAMVQDITERVHAEKALRQAKDFAENLIETANIIFVELDISGNVVRLNEAASRITGYSLPDVRGRNWFEVLVPRNRFPYVWNEFTQITRKGEVPRTFENPILTRSGEERYIVWQNSLLQQDEKIIGTISFGVDITERKHAEEFASRRNTQLRILSSAVQKINTVLEIPAIMQNLTASAMEITGSTAGSAGMVTGGKMVFSEYNDNGRLFPIDYVFEKGYGVPGHVMETKSPYISNDAGNDPYVIQDIRKTLGFYNLANIPILDRKGDVLGSFQIHNTRDHRPYDQQDIELLQGLSASAAIALENTGMLNEISKAEEKYRTLFETMAQGVVYQDSEGKIFSANPAAERMLGLTLDQMTGRTSVDPGWKAIHEDGSDFPGETHPAMIALRKNTEIRNVVMGVFNPVRNEYRWINVNAMPQTRPGENTPYQVYATFSDITDLKRAKDEMRLANEDLRIINKIISVATGFLEIDQILETVLDECIKIIGLEGGTICYVRPDEILQLAVQRNTSKETIEDLTTNKIRIGECLCGAVARDFKPLILPDRESVLKFATREAIRKEDIRYHAAYPLITGGKCMGVLCLFTRRDKKPDEKKLKILELISSQVALSIQNSELYAEIREYTKTLEKKVEQRTAELKDSQAGLLNLMDDINSTAAELEKANKRLIELDRMKSIFIASTSHELRTPLNSIIGFTSILLEGWSGKLTPEQREQVQIVNTSGKHLLSLINDVIDISKIEAGKLDVHVSSFNLKEVINEVVSTLKHELDGKGLAVNIDVMDIEMNTDRRRLLQCLMNLVSNAVKFTEKGGIEIIAKPINEEIEICVKDSGIGIKKEDIPKLFAAFVRLDSPLTARTSGTGLGLYLTMKLTREVLEGTIEVESEYGKGSTFTLHIPREVKH